MKNNNVIGIDLGGTNVRAGMVQEDNLINIKSKKINNNGTVEEVLEDLFELTDALINNQTAAIGIGVPGLIDVDQQLVYDVVNIPSWKEVPLQKWMEERYNIPVYINNDANCFALGEFYFGKGKGHSSMIGLTLGTGLGSGIIINNQLYSGANCGAGEFGMVPYLEHCFEYYASGQFFQNVFHTDGEVVFDLASNGALDALSKYDAFGTHLGNAIKMILFALDPSCIILGGSVRKGWPYFEKTMWNSINNFAYRRSLKKLQIEVSELENSGILGAAALYYDSLKNV